MNHQVTYSFISRLQCLYIVEFIGASWKRPSDIELVLEYMDQTDMKEVLYHRKPTEFTWSEKLQCALSIIEGLVYLHSMTIIHRDLKSRNVLMDSKKGTKLTDFGISREDTGETMTVGVGTYRWMAPEILQDNHYTIASDIFSFGMILSELDTHHIPYSDLRNAKGYKLVDTAIISLVIQNAIKPTFTADCPPWIQDLAFQCIARNPEDRPTAMEVSMILRQKMQHRRMLV